MIYRLKPGAKYGDMKPGDEIELSEAGAKALQGKFEPAVAPPLPPADQPATVAPVPSAPPTAAVPAEGWDLLLDGSVGAVNIQVEKMTSAERLRSLVAAEEAGKNRKGVLAAARRRLEELAE